MFLNPWRDAATGSCACWPGSLSLYRSRNICVYIHDARQMLVDCTRHSSVLDHINFLKDRSLLDVKKANLNQKSRVAWKSLRTLLAFSRKKSKVAKAVQALEGPEEKSSTDPVNIGHSKLDYFGCVESAGFVTLDKVVQIGNSTRTPLPDV